MTALPAYRKGTTVLCPVCSQKVGVVQPDGAILHHDYRSKIRLIAGRMELDCQRCKAVLELRATPETMP